MEDEADDAEREKNDVRFDLKDRSHIRFKGTNELRNRLAQVLGDHFKL